MGFVLTSSASLPSVVAYLASVFTLRESPYSLAFLTRTHTHTHAQGDGRTLWTVLSIKAMELLF